MCPIYSDCVIAHSTGLVACTGSNDAHPYTGWSCVANFTHIVNFPNGNDACVDNGCPPHAIGSPSCGCDNANGYYGELTAPVDTGNWTGECKRMRENLSHGTGCFQRFHVLSKFFF